MNPISPVSILHFYILIYTESEKKIPAPQQPQRARFYFALCPQKQNKEFQIKRKDIWRRMKMASKTVYQEIRFGGHVSFASQSQLISKHTHTHTFANAHKNYFCLLARR